MLHHIDCQFINMEKVSPVFYRKTEPFIPTHDKQRLHREIGKENWGYHEIRQRVIEIKKGM